MLISAKVTPAQEVPESEEPDLLILTGDIVRGKPTIESREILTDLLIGYKIPYAVTFGNHEDEAGVSRWGLLEYLSGRPYCLISDDAGEEVKGYANYMLPVYIQGGKAEKLIYCLDSRSYTLARDKGVEGYGWFD